jgi:hypothetical protein
MINSSAQEVSYAGVGRFTNGVDVTEVWTYINSHTPSGAIQGVGHGTSNVRVTANNIIPHNRSLETRRDLKRLVMEKRSASCNVGVALN